MKNVPKRKFSSRNLYRNYFKALVLATCRNQNAPIERINGVVKNCLYQDCSANYQCEYNSVFNQGQYICCGSPSWDDGSGGNGKIKLHQTIVSFKIKKTKHKQKTIKRNLKTFKNFYSILCDVYSKI